jgi:hypothetical protein
MPTLEYVTPTSGFSEIGFGVYGLGLGVQDRFWGFEV